MSNILVKADCDLGITKSQSELRKLNKRAVAKAIERLSAPIIAELEAVFKEFVSF